LAKSPEKYMNPENLPEVPEGRLRLVPLGGVGEIGMNCMILETTRDLIVLDCGKLFSDMSHFGVEYIIPDFRYLHSRMHKLRALVITHGHEDHVGGIQFAVSQGVRCPIYASPFTSRLIESRLVQAGQERHVELLNEYTIGDTLDFPSFKIQTIPVTHSLVECAALIIDTPVGRIIETGDWRIDRAPYYPIHVDWKSLEAHPAAGTLLLLSDSTNVENLHESVSEQTVGENLEKEIADSQGKTFITMFASNVARMSQVFESAERLGKKVALCGRSMETFFHLTAEFGYIARGRNCYISSDDIHKYPREDVLILCTGSQGEPRSALARMARDEYPWCKIEPGDRILYSARVIPGNEKAITRLINDILRRGAEVLYESTLGIHASGHATRSELKQMIERVKPHFFVPIHGEYRHLVRHRELAIEAGIPAEKTVVIQNYDVLEVAPGILEKVASLETDRIYVEGPDDMLLTREVLRSRRAIAEKGLLTAIVPVSASHWKLHSPVRLIQHGVCSDEEKSDMFYEVEHVVVDTLNRVVRQDSARTIAALEEAIRVEVRRYLSRETGKKIPVSIAVLEL
jgi:ribonuclease J